MQCRIENLNEKKGTFTLQFKDYNYISDYNKFIFYV